MDSGLEKAKRSQPDQFSNQLDEITIEIKRIRKDVDEGKSKYSQPSKLPSNNMDELYLSLIKKQLSVLLDILIITSRKSQLYTTLPYNIFSINVGYLKSDIDFIHESVKHRQRFVEKMANIFSIFLDIVAEIGDNSFAINLKDISEKTKSILKNFCHHWGISSIFTSFEYNYTTLSHSQPTLNEIDILMSSLRIVATKMDIILDSPAEYITKTVKNQFYKTRICKHWRENGYCNDQSCNYAHGNGELRSLDSPNYF